MKQAPSSLRRLLQPLLLVAVAPLVFALLGYVYLERVHSLLLLEVQRNLSDMALQGASVIEARLQGRITALETLAVHPLLSSENTSFTQKMGLLKREVQRSGALRLGLIRLSGEASTTDEQMLFLNDRRYFVEAKYGSPYISEVLSSKLDRSAVVVQSVPVRNAAGDVMGVLFAADQAPLLATQLNTRFSYAGGGAAHLIDANGVMLDAHTDKDNNIYKKLSMENPASAVSLFRRQMRIADSPLESLVWAGEDVYAITVPVPGVSGWSLVLTVPKSAATEKMRPVLALTFAALAGIIFLLMGTGFYILGLRKGYVRQRGFAEAAIHSAGIYQLDVDDTGQILSCNELFRARMGFAPDGPLPNLHDTALDQCREDMEKALKNQESFAQKLQAKGEEVLFVQWHVLPSPSSGVCTLLGTDFSAREEASESQRAALAMRDMQQVFDNIPFPMTLRTPDNRLRMANRTLTGLGNSEAISGMRFGGLVPKNEVQLLADALDEAVRTKRSVSTPHSTCSYDGVVRYYNNTQTPLLNDAGDVTSVVSISVDVTDSVRVQEHLSEEVQRFRDLLDTSPVGVIITQKGVVRFRNLRARQMVGLEVGGSVHDVTLKEGSVASVLAQLEGKPVIRDVPFSLNDPRGRLRHLLLTVSRTQLEGEQAMLVWAVDVTALKDVESQLIAARDTAEAATHAKSDFLATMSHEIRTPMNAVLGFLHLFDRQNLSPHQLDYLDKISVSATGLLRIINDILDFSKIEAGKLAMENLPFQLGACVDAVHSIMCFSARDKGLSLDTHLSEDLPEFVCGDKERLNQVLINLLNNAVKFTTKGRITLEVAPAPGQDEDLIAATGLELLFTVSDTGIGMSEEQIARIFQPFTQAEASTSRQFGGTGLGLVISRRLVQLMHGDIEVNSAPGFGTTFRFSIRVQTVAQFEAAHGHGNAMVPDLAAPRGARPAEDKNMSWQGLRLLVVEDNEINQEIAGAMLTQLGFEVDFADDGYAALDKVEDNDDYSLIFMDMQMPGIDGLETTRRIRALSAVKPELQHLPIIAMTANAMQEDRRRCLEAGMNDHLAKPIDPQSLQALLAQWLKPGAAAPTAR